VETALSAQSSAVLGNRYTICASPGEQAIAYPVPGPNFSFEPGKRQFNIVWYHAATEDKLVQLSTDDSGRYYPNGIPPALLSKSVREEMIAIAQHALAPPFAEAVRVSPVLFFQPIFDMEPERMALGRVAVVGDAAFIARPHTAMGVSKAGSDVLALVDAIARCGRDYASGLKAFEAARMPVNRVIVANGRYLGMYMEAQTKSEEERRKAEEMRTADYILAMAMPMDD
jgi:2-polyprenyl-6-methoxyphenol hydroxylase-like FAD-dependent oxidoreductase